MYASFECPRCKSERFTLQLHVENTMEHNTGFLQCEECHQEIWIQGQKGTEFALLPNSYATPPRAFLDDERGHDWTAGPITDPAGYLPCGCHGSQRDHTCKDDYSGEVDERDQI